MFGPEGLKNISMGITSFGYNVLNDITKMGGCFE